MHRYKRVTFPPFHGLWKLAQETRVLAAYYYAEYQVSSFSGGGGGTGLTGTLPVEMAYFKAQAEGRAVVLEWATYSELNNKGFYIQRQSEANWEEVAFVAGQDQSNQSHAYQFSDQPPAGKNHFVYRLAQEDWDGSRSFSDQVEVYLGASPMTLYPSPNDGNFTLDLGTSYQQVQLRFLGVDGKVIDQQQHRQVQQIEMQSDLPAGFYLLEVQADASPTQTLKLVIE